LKNFYWLAGLILLTSCVNVPKYNARLEKPIAATQLRADVNFTVKKLEQFHPYLYDYISKDEFYRKADSLKSTINSALTPFEFYKKLAPLVAEIRQGHLTLPPPQKRFTKEEKKYFSERSPLFTQFEYRVKDHQLFISENKDSIKKFPAGTEIIAIDDIPVRSMLAKYEKYYASDGYNTTFIPYITAKRWSGYFTAEHGLKDSAQMTVRTDENTQTVWLKRKIIAQDDKKENSLRIKEIKKSDSGRVADYNASSKSFNRELSFLTTDSTVAKITVKTFSRTYSSKFYKETFEKLKKTPARYLILDIRNNTGGALSEVNNLYSYLVNEDFQFINDIEITGTGSLLRADYLKNMNWKLKSWAVLTYPIYFAGSLLATKKVNGKTYMRNNNKIAAIRHSKDNAFKGRLYVLINGSSFSASSILSAKLKDARRATLVGEETGGANDGTVAGRYVTVQLPNSKLRLPIGMMLIQPAIDFTKTQKGVEPHIEIIPTLEQELSGQDVQLDYILNEIAAEKDSAAINLL